ncbi:MAG TPA: selenocysteine-specific translation elongation factor, partial [Gemmatimonadaceae bacterium]|nr:selenocysteine-specific translation elongation factor [Gemmatimonadaceae bacterium]
MILGTAGHIDHGKTTLVHALTGVDTDRLPEEKRRGITIELGFAPLTVEGVGTIGVVDVPGHEAFVRTMVAGASGIDLALLVVAADEGVMPQTREHLAILELLGVSNGVIALTKVDLVDDDWLALVEEDVRQTAMRALPGAPVIATSTRTGRGIAELRAAIAAAARAVAPRENGDLFRMPIDRAFTIKGTGTVVTGTVWTGRISRDEVVRILPGNRTARVRGIQGHGQQLDAAAPGARTAIALAGIETSEVPRGSTIVTEAAWAPTTVVRADVTILPGIEGSIGPRTRFRFHAGTSDVGARVVGRDVAAGRPFGARVVLDEPVVLRGGDRFVLRSSAPLNTVGGGVVTDAYASRRARQWRPGLDAAERFRRMVEESGSAGVEIATLPVRLGSTPTACGALLQALESELTLVAARVVSRALHVELEQRIVGLVEAFHAENPLEPGMSAQLARSRTGVAPELVESAIQARVREGALESIGGLLKLHNWAPMLSPVHRHLAERVRAKLAEAGSE